VTLRDQVRRLLEHVGEGLAPIVEVGDPVLRAVTAPYDGQLDDTELTALIDLMHRTMLDAPGVGLAAPQIGLSVALAVMEDPGIGHPDLEAARERVPVPFQVLVNPAYVPVGEERVGFYEGCLSVPGYAAVVNRYRTVQVTAADHRGVVREQTMRGWPARIVQHETDHLAGEVYLDHAELRSLALSAGWGGHWAAEPIPRTAAVELGFDLS